MTFTTRGHTKFAYGRAEKIERFGCEVMFRAKPKDFNLSFFYLDVLLDKSTIEKAAKAHSMGVY